MPNEIEHAAKVGGGGGGNNGKPDSRVDKERRLFRDYALSHESLRDLFASLAADHVSLTDDQRGERLLAISNELARLREETEKARIGTRELAVEYMKGP